MLEIGVEDVSKCIEEYNNSQERVQEINSKLDEFINAAQNQYSEEAFQKFLQLTHDVNYEAGYLKGIEKVLNILGYEITK